MGLSMRPFIFYGFILTGLAQLIAPPENFFWPNATIFYSVDGSFDQADQSVLQAAIADYHAKTCIRWVQRSSQPAFVNFLKNNDPGCASADSCYWGTKLNARFHPTCVTLNTLVHEMGHTLCFGHEQDRIDRDNYLVKYAGTCPGPYNHLNFGHLYDYKSVMHYGCGSGCTIPSRPGVTSCGSGGEGLSVLDAEKLNDMYKCGGCFAYRFKFPHLINVNQDNPVVAGLDGTRDVFICRAYVEGDIVPGKAVLGGSPACWVSYKGREYGMDSGFEVLTNPWKEANLRWTQEGSVSSIPPNAIAGGRTASGETLYVARCLRDIGGGQKMLIPGKIYKTAPQKMYYAFAGLEYECTNYQLLVCG